MRHLALYVVTVLVALGLVYAFVTPFTGGLDTPAISSQGVDVTPESFELPDEMKNDVTDEGSESAATQERVTSPEARQVDPDVPLVPNNQTAPLERIEPRQPLSDIGQASPPRTASARCAGRQHGKTAAALPPGCDNSRYDRGFRLQDRA